MKLYAPKYYKNFKCIADRCENSCCIGWEIEVDERALDKYASLSHSYAENINKSIDFYNGPHFNLSSNNKCPHLSENGLCRIIVNCGEEYLCDICREHPRFYNFTNRGKELGVGMSCEAACELILNSNDYDEFIEYADTDGEIEPCDYDATQDREVVFEILKNKNTDICGAINAISERFNVDLVTINNLAQMPDLEYLREDHKMLFSKFEKIFWRKSISAQLKRILAYFVYRHCSEAYGYEDFCISLSFAIFCTGIISTLGKENIGDIARIVSEEIEYSEDNIETIKSIFY